MGNLKVELEFGRIYYFQVLRKSLYLELSSWFYPVIDFIKDVSFYDLLYFIFHEFGETGLPVGSSTVP